jgi:hypothetical protein
MKEKIIILVLLSLLITRCNNKENASDSLLLKMSIKQLQTENDELVNEIKIKMNGSASVEPYFNLSLKLNNLISHFVKQHSQNQLNKIDSSEILKLNTNYHNVIDSIKKSYSFKLFMPMDDSLLQSIKFNNIETKSGTEELSTYLTLQDIILNHRTAIKTFRYGISICSIWFTKFDDLGYMVNINIIDNTYEVKIHYDYPKRYAEYSLIGIEKLESSNEKSIQINNLHITKNDTLIFNINYNNQRNLKAFVKYKVIKCTGEMDTINIEMPFNLK